MRVVVIGATGNVGTSLIQALSGEPEVESILGLARRRPQWDPPKTEWAEADIVGSDLAPHLRGADAVVHLAWLIQPSRDEETLRAANVAGSERVFQAVADAGTPTLIYASSVGAYSAGPKDRMVDEGWPTNGISTSFYSRHKAEVERILDRFEADSSIARVVRLRPGLIFKGEAAEEIRRLFAGPFLPSFLVHPRLIPVIPKISGLRFQAVHSRDVGEAYRLALTREVHGAFNIAADPVIGPPELAEVLGAQPLRVPGSVVRALTSVTWRLRLQPTPPGWVDLALGSPLMDTRRAREELGWSPKHGSLEALMELLEGIRGGRGMPTPPLDEDAGGPARSGEIRSGIGGRNP
jgi:nucleoside-diphosphate-sugar epimerase